MLFRIIIVFLGLSIAIHSSQLSINYGCTLSVAYWKNYNSFGKSSEKKIPWPRNCHNGDDPFRYPENNVFMSGKQTWLEVLMRPKNESNYCLEFSKQITAIRLNECNGANLKPDLKQTSVDLTTLLEHNCTFDNRRTSRKEIDNKSHDFKNWVDAATMLNFFNEGFTNVRRCENNDNLDCNKNGIADHCELEDYFSNKNICDDSGEIIHRESLRCILSDSENSRKKLCHIEEHGSYERDCNENMVLDICEISSKSQTWCDSDLCAIRRNARRTHTDCLSCRSLDKDLNGIPDMCEFPTNHVDIKEDWKDCNENMIPDLSDIITEYSSDRNLNWIPDECETGSCCENSICRNGNMKKCEKGLFYPVLCSERSDCKRVLHHNFGSCCKRTSPQNSNTQCFENITEIECQKSRGIFSKQECLARDCSDMVGVCCSGKNSGCLMDTRHYICKELWPVAVFDVSTCSKNHENLCNMKSNSSGSCKYNDECLDSVSLDECSKVFTGSFDFIECRYRLDIMENQIGSCCSSEFKCIENISPSECEKSDGYFSYDTCENTGFCEDHSDGKCCTDLSTCFFKDHMPCHSKGTAFFEFECENVAICLEYSNTQTGCCLINGECSVYVEEDQCVLFGGEYMNREKCLEISECHFDIKNLTSPQEKGFEFKPYVEDTFLSEKETTSVGQIINIVVFSVIFGIVLFLYIAISSRVIFKSEDII